MVRRRSRRPRVAHRVRGQYAAARVVRGARRARAGPNRRALGDRRAAMARPGHRAVVLRGRGRGADRAGGRCRAAPVARDVRPAVALFGCPGRPAGGRGGGAGVAGFGAGHRLCCAARYVSAAAAGRSQPCRAVASRPGYRPGWRGRRLGGRTGGGNPVRRTGRRNAALRGDRLVVERRVGGMLGTDPRDCRVKRRRWHTGVRPKPNAAPAAASRS